jgi:hypothetical protein
MHRAIELPSIPRRNLDCFESSTKVDWGAFLDATRNCVALAQLALSVLSCGPGEKAVSEHVNRTDYLELER